MNSLKIKIFAAAALTLTVFGTAPASAAMNPNGWTNGWSNGWNNGFNNGFSNGFKNGWQNAWTNGLSAGLNTKADGHALRVTGIEFPAE